jgi:diacylglycerol kinase
MSEKREFKNQYPHKRVNNAFVGLKHMIANEMTIQIQFLFFFVILYFGNIFEISRLDWLVLILTFTIVICLEMVNSLAEELCDLYSLDHNLHIKKIKDIAAGAVLLASLSLIIVVTIIFLPYLQF